LLLQVIAAGDAVGVDVRLAAAVNFKNTVKYRWVSWLNRLARPGHGLQQHVQSLPVHLLQVPTELAVESGTQPVPDQEKV